MRHLSFLPTLNSYILCFFLCIYAICRSVRSVLCTKYTKPHEDVFFVVYHVYHRCKWLWVIIESWTYYGNRLHSRLCKGFHLKLYRPAYFITIARLNKYLYIIPINIHSKKVESSVRYTHTDRENCRCYAAISSHLPSMVCR